MNEPNKISLLEENRKDIQMEEGLVEPSVHMCPISFLCQGHQRKLSSHIYSQGNDLVIVVKHALRISHL